MHEFSFCREIVDIVLSEMGKVSPSCHLIKTCIVAGKLRQIIPDFLTFAYEILTKDTAAEGSDLEIKIIPIVIKCRQCGWSGEVAEELFFQCAECDSNKVEIISGKELYLESLEIDNDE